MEEGDEELSSFLQEANAIINNPATTNNFESVFIVELLIFVEQNQIVKQISDGPLLHTKQIH
jgi:hypothetical protein